MNGIWILFVLIFVGTPVVAQTLGEIDPPEGCEFEEAAAGRLECRFEDQEGNLIHLIHIEQVFGLQTGAEVAFAEDARQITTERVEGILSGFATGHLGMKEGDFSIEDVTADHMFALFCGEGGATYSLTSKVDFNVRIRECVFAPSVPGMMPDFGVIETMLYHQFFAAGEPSEDVKGDATGVFHSLKISLPSVQIEITAEDFMDRCSKTDTAEDCQSIVSEVFGYSEWIAPYWPLNVSQKAWLECIERTKELGIADWLNEDSEMESDAAHLPAHMYIFDSLTRRCN